MQKKKKQFLKELSLFEVSLVKEPAVPKAKILVSKSKNENNKYEIKKHIDIEKAVEKKVYGYALVSNQEDSQGHTITPEQVKYATEIYQKNIAMGLKKGTGTGYEHTYFDSEYGYPVLSWYDEDGSFAKALGFPDESIEKQAMIVGVQLTDKGYDKYKSGDITGFSIGGTGKIEDIEIEEQSDFEKSITSQSFPRWLTQFYSKMKALLDTEANNLPDDAKDYIIRNTISNIIGETQYQVYAMVESDEQEERFDVMFSNDNTNKEESNSKKIIEKKEVENKEQEKKQGFFKRLFNFTKSNDNKQEAKKVDKQEISQMIDDKINPIVEQLKNLQHTNVDEEQQESKTEEQKAVQKSDDNQSDELVELIKTQGEQIKMLSEQLEDLKANRKAKSKQITGEEQVQKNEQAFNIWDIKEAK